MKERTIIFNTEMVRAILEGRKTQTRRPIKPQPIFERGAWCVPGFFCNTEKGFKEDLLRSAFKCPWRIGDRLWVRETWCESKYEDEYGALYYKANGPFKRNYKWRSSIHMPKWVARIWLEIINIRVERLQDIRANEKDLIAEGMHREDKRSYSDEFHDRWDSVYGNFNRWDFNPWVWVIEFKRWWL